MIRYVLSRDELAIFGTFPAAYSKLSHSDVDANAETHGVAKCDPL